MRLMVDSEVVKAYISNLGVMGDRYKAGTKLLDYTYNSPLPLEVGVTKKEAKSDLPLMGRIRNIFTDKRKANTKLSFKEAVSLSPLFKEKGVADVINKFFSGHENVVFGSVAEKMWLGKDYHRNPVDVNLFAYINTRKLIDELKAFFGDNIRLDPEQTDVIQILHKGRWTRAFDIYGYKQLRKKENKWGKEPYIGYGKMRCGPIKTEDGLLISDLRELATKKAVSVLTIREFGAAPAPHRLLDVFDWLDMADYMAKYSGNKEMLECIKEFKATIPQSVIQKFNSPEYRTRWALERD